MHKKSLLNTPHGEPVVRDEYLEDGLLHREDGPAVVCSDGLEAWYRHGLLHREDGPAVADPGTHYLAWFRDGVAQRVEHGSGVVFSLAPANA